MPKKCTVDFLGVMSEGVSEATQYRFEYDFRKICIYLESLSFSDRKSIFSDSYWNKYPKYVYWKQFGKENIRSHGRGLKLLTKYLSSNKHKYPNTYKSVLNYSKGIILNFAIDSFSGKEKLKLAKNGIDSKDTRVRKVAARILPLNMIKSMVDDSDWGVRSIVSTRISPYANPELFVNSKSYHARIAAISASDFDKETIFAMIKEREGVSHKGHKEWYKKMEVVCLLDKLDDTDLLYFIDLAGIKGGPYSDYFNSRLS